MTPFDRLDQLPRLPLAVAPTPLVRAESLERALRDELGREVPRLMLKLDSYTGFGMGGNKVRKLEYVLAPERIEGVTHLVTAGGVQSNHARVTAAAAARLGLGCKLVVSGEPSEPPRGNAYLHRLFGADVRTVRDRDERDSTMDRVAREISEAGGHPLVIPLGASTPLGALGYVRAGREFLDQMVGTIPDDEPTTVFISSSSCGTLAGIHLAFSLAPSERLRLVGVSADTTREDILTHTAEIAAGAGLRLGWSGSLATDGLDADDSFVGDGYGLPTPESDHAIQLFARSAGVVLDTTYTAKAAAGFLHRIRGGQVPAGQTAVFWHTGGWPAALI